MKHQIFATTFLLCAFACVSSSFSQSSNQKQVRAELHKGGYTVIWGDKFTESDWLEAGAAIYASIQTGNAVPFIEYMRRTTGQTFRAMAGQGLTDHQIRSIVLSTFKTGKPVTFRGLEIEAGIATYKRWKTVGAHYPEWYGLFDVRWTYGSTKIPLPNWHDPYIRFRKQTNHGRALTPRTTRTALRLGSIPRSISVECFDKQEAGGDDIYLIIKRDGELANLQNCTGVGPSQRWKMRDGDRKSVGFRGLSSLEFSNSLEITLVEFDSLSSNEILGKATFYRGSNETKPIQSGNFG